MEVGGGEYPPHEVVSEMVALSELPVYGSSAISDDALKQRDIRPSGKLHDGNAGLEQCSDEQRPGKQGYDAFLSEACSQASARPCAYGEQDEHPGNDIVHAWVNQIHQPCLQPPECRHCKQEKAEGRNFCIKQFLPCSQKQ